VSAVRLATHQPAYLPYLGLFYKMTQADRFMFDDRAQFEKKLFQNRNYVRSTTGKILLTVPVQTKGREFQSTNEVMIENATPWARKHWRTIYLNYRGTPFFKDYAGFFEEVYAKPWQRLVDLSVTITLYLMRCFGIEREVMFGSQYRIAGQKTDLLIDMCRKTECDTYVAGWGGKTYIDVEKFRRQGLHLRILRLSHPVYPQQGEPFIPNLAAIDLLFNCGPESRRILDDTAKVSVVEQVDP
jgi:hypothetical protein